MKKSFVNYQLIVSLWGCSLFIAFLAIIGTLYFHQKAFAHGKNLKKIEIQCNALQNEILSLSAKIAQMEAPCYLKQNLPVPLIPQEQVFHVRHWSSYKGSHMTRNALTLNITQGTTAF
ncbi:MAG: hypothetical protein LBB11_00320 [Puniceicoccales bacterium]|jgi:hypothetical protein|nr:hypothetical protein [Puniceicoccales bacterium]